MNSVSLIKWSDVIIGMHSSIMIEALIQDKVYISPAYFRHEKMIYEQYGACWIVNSYDELKAALSQLNHNKKYRPYTKKAETDFLTDVVYDGEENKDVLESYRSFILDIVKNGRRDRLTMDIY